MMCSLYGNGRGIVEPINSIAIQLRFKTMAIGAERLEIGGIIVAVITVDVVHI
jgi:hypothetical protein